ncbi:MAG: hypothetical protein HC829_05120, partial [Bacteroidales bacterium]|nr:hypothetical protein [Bacteroidales bacterium]
GASRREAELHELLALALDLLEADGRPYFLLLEAGRIDHAGHDNDAAALVAEQLEFLLPCGEALPEAHRLGGEGGDLGSLVVRQACSFIDKPLKAGQRRLPVRQQGGDLFERLGAGGKLLLQRSQLVGQRLVLGAKRLQGGVLFHQFGLEAEDRLGLAPDLGQLLGGLLPQGGHLDLQAAGGHGELGAEQILVGLNLGQRHRHEALDPPAG